MKFSNTTKFITISLLCPWVKGDYTFGRPVTLSTENTTYPGTRLVNNMINGGAVNTLSEALPWMNIQLLESG